jgi:hypothetical protein
MTGNFIVAIAFLSLTCKNNCFFFKSYPPLILRSILFSSSGTFRLTEEVFPLELREKKIVLSLRENNHKLFLLLAPSKPRSSLSIFSGLNLKPAVIIGPEI